MDAHSGNSTEGLVAQLRKDASAQFNGSHKRAMQHNVAAGFWGIVHRGLTATAAVASAIAGTTVFTVATGGWRIAGGVLALVAAALSTLDVTLRAGQLAEDHKRGFDGFTQMRTKWLQFKDVDMNLGSSPEDLAAEFRKLIGDRGQLSERVPAPLGWWKSRKQLHASE